MTADDDYKLLQVGIGFTNMVARATKGSADLTRKEIKEGIILLCLPALHRLCIVKNRHHFRLLSLSIVVSICHFQLFQYQETLNSLVGNYSLAVSLWEDCE